MNKKGNLMLIGLVILILVALFFVAKYAGLLAIEPEGGIFVNQAGSRQFNDRDTLKVIGGVTENAGENYPVGSAIYIDGQLCRADTRTITNLVRVVDGTITYYSQEFLGSNDLGSAVLIERDCTLSGGYHNVRAINARLIKFPGGGYMDRGADDTYWTIEETIFVIPSPLTTTTTIPGITGTTTTIASGQTTTTTQGNTGKGGGGTSGTQKGIFVSLINWFKSLFGKVTWT